MSEPKSIQDRVEEILTEMGVHTASLLHTILLRDRHFIGHKYRFDGGWAIWLAENNVVEVYDEEGKLLRSAVFEREKAA